MDNERLDHANNLKIRIDNARRELGRWERLKDFRLLRRASLDINGKENGDLTEEFGLTVSDGVFQEFRLKAMTEIRVYLNGLEAEFESI